MSSSDSVAIPNNISDERQMKFFKVENENPKTLCKQQIDFFNQQGYLKNLPLFTTEEVNKNKLDFDNLLEVFLKAGKNSYSINGCHVSCETIWDIAANSRIHDFVEDILGPNFVAWGTHFFCKMPGDGKAVSWHQDAPYWPFTPTKTVTAWVAIDDVAVENSAMEVIPTSHLLGPIKTRQSRPEENNVLWETIDSNILNYEKPISMSMKAGEMSLHSDLLIHGSKPNTSNRRRCGLTIRYASTDVRSTKNWNSSSIICRGKDISGHWKNRPRPIGNNPFVSVKAIGAN